MAEVFSVVSAAAGLLDVTLRLVNYARELKKGTASIEKELDSLIEQACMLEQVCNAVKYSHERSMSRMEKRKEEQNGREQSNNAIRTMWDHMARSINRCQTLVEEIRQILQDICQPHHQGFSKRLDALGKVHRRRVNEGDLQKCQNELSAHHSSIQILLTVINSEETRDLQDSSAKSFEDLTAQLGTLQSQISKLEQSSNYTDSVSKDDKEALSALRELKSYIAKAAELVTSRPAINKYFKTPQSVSSIFTGREALLQQLRDCFIQQPGPLHSQYQRRFVIHGLGGSGKTQFCCKFAEENRHRFWGVFSIDGSSVESIKKSLCDIAKLAGRDPNANAALDWLSTIEERWLLLIDNADDGDVKLENYFPRGVGGHILITTRNSAFRVLGNVEPGYYDFSGLQFEEASSLLLKASSLPRPWSSSVEDLASNITRALGYLALAIVQAGAAIRERLCSLQDYLEWYERSWQKLRDDKVRPATHHERAVWTTFEICYQRLEEKRDRTEAADAIELLHVFAFLYRDNLSPAILIKALKNAHLEAENEQRVALEEELSRSTENSSLSGKLRKTLASMLMFMTGQQTPTPLPSVIRDGQQGNGLEAAEDRIRGALSELEKMSLIYYNERSQTYSMHPVVHDWARKRPRMKLRHQALWADIAGHVLAASILLPPLGTTTEDELYHATLLPHVEHIQKCRADIGIQLSKKANRSCLPWLTKASPVNADRIRMYAKFGLVYTQCGKLDSAEKLFKEVAACLSLYVGPESPRTRAAHTALAAVYWQQGRVNEALDLQRGIVAMCQKYLGRENPETLRAVHRLSITLWQQGRYSAAKELLVEVVEGFTKLLGPNHVDTLEAINNLGRTVVKFMGQNDLREAFRLFSEALKGMRDTVGNDHLLATYPKENIARVACLIGERPLLDYSLQLMEEVIATRKARMGKEASWTLMAMGNMAVVLGALGRLQEGEQLILEALPIAERNMGPGHIGVLFGRQVLAALLIQQERYDEAENILIRAIRDQKSMTSRSNNYHPDRIVSMVELARCYALQGKLADSIDICSKAIKGMEQVAEHGHPFIGIMKDAQRKMEERLKNGLNPKEKLDVRFPECLFKIYH
ncbi:tetratricopeptide repeat domain-containing protein [Nemania sp. FL0916]|nr:tetratricopeptide repeat domain-containing protein [Nemania sp. FL0916]